MEIANNDIVKYAVAGIITEVTVLETFNSHYGTRHRVALNNDVLLDGFQYSKGDIFDGDIYSDSAYYTVSLFN